MGSGLERAIMLKREGLPPAEVGAGRALMEPMETARRGVNARATQLATRILFDVAAPRLPCDVKLFTDLTFSAIILTLDERTSAPADMLWRGGR